MDHSYAWSLWIVVRKKLRTSPFLKILNESSYQTSIDGEMVQNVDLKKIKVIYSHADYWIWFDHTPKQSSPDLDKFLVFKASFSGRFDSFRKTCDNQC